MTRCVLLVLVGAHVCEPSEQVGGAASSRGNDVYDTEPGRRVVFSALICECLASKLVRRSRGKSGSAAAAAVHEQL